MTADRAIPDAELVIANAVAELRIALGHLWAGTDGRFVTGAELVETIADGLEAVLNRTETP